MLERVYSCRKFIISVVIDSLKSIQQMISERLTNRLILVCYSSMAIYRMTLQKDEKITKNAGCDRNIKFNNGECSVMYSTPYVELILLKYKP